MGSGFENLTLFGLLSLMLLIGTLLRAKVKLFQDYLVPASIIGGLIGIAVGIGIGAIACKAVQHIPMVMSWKSVLGSFGVSLAIGVFFGYYPANKAAKMDPIEALRYE